MAARFERYLQTGSGRAFAKRHSERRRLDDDVVHPPELCRSNHWSIYPMADDRRTCLMVSTWAGRWRKAETDTDTNKQTGQD